MARGINLQSIYSHRSGQAGRQAGRAGMGTGAVATGPGDRRKGQVSKVFTQHKNRRGSIHREPGSVQGRLRVGSGRVASMSFVSLINCISIIISCSLTSSRHGPGIRSRISYQHPLMLAVSASSLSLNSR